MSIDDMNLDGLVHVRMSFEAGRQAEQSGHIVRNWFDNAWRELGGSIRERVLAAPPTGESVRWGLHVQGEFSQDGDPFLGFQNDYARWHELLDWVATRPFDRAAFFAAGSDGGGTMLSPYRTDEYFEINAFREFREGREVVQLTVESKENHLYASEESQMAVVSFLDSALQGVDADYAEAGFGYGGLGTCVDSISYIPWEESAGQGRETLRGYGWLTFVPESLLHRVGGLDGLRGSGAFAAVTEMPHGGVLLRATENFRDFGDVEATPIFQQLRGILRPQARASAFRRKIQVQGM